MDTHVMRFCIMNRFSVAVGSGHPGRRSEAESLLATESEKLRGSPFRLFGLFTVHSVIPLPIFQSQVYRGLLGPRNHGRKRLAGGR